MSPILSFLILSGSHNMMTMMMMMMMIITVSVSPQADASPQEDGACIDRGHWAARTRTVNLQSVTVRGNLWVVTLMSTELLKFEAAGIFTSSLAFVAPQCFCELHHFNAFLGKMGLFVHVEPPVAARKCLNSYNKPHFVKNLHFSWFADLFWPVLAHG